MNDPRFPNVDDSSNAYQDLIGQTPAALRLQSYAKANMPAAAKWTNSMIYVTDETGGAVPAFSDGSSWRRVTDRAIVS